MPELIIPDIDLTTLELLRQRADNHAHTVEIEAKVILAEAVRTSVSHPHDPWAVFDTMLEELAQSGQEFTDSTPLIREDRDR